MPLDAVTGDTRAKRAIEKTDAEVAAKKDEAPN
jgi:hypothetical protein